MATHKRTHEDFEKGNAVALTLLGLSVALLAGMVVLYLIGVDRPKPIPLELITTTTENIGSDVEDEYAEWETYRNEVFEFSVQYPSGWAIAENLEDEYPVITMYDASQAQGTNTPSSIHDYNTRVSIYPKGNPALKMVGTEVPSKTIIPIRGASAKDYILEGTKSAWATTVRFDSTPAIWSSEGQLLARSSVEEESRTFLRGSEEIDESEFDLLNGDTILHYGFVNPETWNTVSMIVRSFAFTTLKETPETASDAMSSTTAAVGIRITSPVADSVLASPLGVKGVVEGAVATSSVLILSLEDSVGAILATTTANVTQVEGESTVYFESVLEFDTAELATGTLRVTQPEGLYEPLAIPIRLSEE